jgi:cytochrome bd-type quinol oxidase subunit 1
MWDLLESQVPLDSVLGAMMIAIAIILWVLFKKAPRQWQRQLKVAAVILLLLGIYAEVVPWVTT